MKDFLITENCHQIVNEFTRIRNVQGTLQRSCLDHITVNCLNKLTTPQILGVGQSDHLGTFVTRKSREIRTNPRTIKKRIYNYYQISYVLCMDHRLEIIYKDEYLIMYKPKYLLFRNKIILPLQV